MKDDRELLTAIDLLECRNPCYFLPPSTLALTSISRCC